jgi:hypothetical protein
MLFEKTKDEIYQTTVSAATSCISAYINEPAMRASLYFQEPAQFLRFKLHKVTDKG